MHPTTIFPEKMVAKLGCWNSTSSTTSIKVYRNAPFLTVHKEPPEVGLVNKLTGSLYWWVEQCVPTLHMMCVYDQKKFEWHFSDRLTFSNTRGRRLFEFTD